MSDDHAEIEAAKAEVDRCERAVRSALLAQQNAKNADEEDLAWAECTAALNARLAALRVYLAVRSNKGSR